MLTHQVDFFGKLYFWPYRVLPLKFLHTLQPTKLYFQSDLGHQVASSWALLHISSLDMHHLTCGISSLLHSVNLILFTLLLVHLILHISPHHGSCLHYHHLSLLWPLTPELQPTRFTNPFCMAPFWLSSQNLNSDQTCRMLAFIYVSLFFYMFCTF